MPHYYDTVQEGPPRWKRIIVQVRGQDMPLWTADGLFSKDRLDEGTRLLLDECSVKPGYRVHDLGCGTGIVGVALKRLEPSCHVLCSDISSRAVSAARKNAEQLKLDIEVRHSDGYARIPEMFDTVLINPPYVAGRAVVFRLLDEAHEHLRPGGLLQAVARHKIGGGMIRAHLLTLFGNCDDSVKSKGYRLYRCVR